MSSSTPSPLYSGAPKPSLNSQQKLSIIWGSLQKQFIAGENSIYFSESEFGVGNYLTNYHTTVLHKLCEISKAELNKKLDDILINKTDDGTKLVDIKPVIENKGGIIPFVGYSIFIILIVLVFFEIIKKVFYYIILGSLNPKK